MATLEAGQHCVSVRPASFGIDKEVVQLLLHRYPPAGFEAVHPADFQAVHSVPASFETVHLVPTGFEAIHSAGFKAGHCFSLVMNRASQFP